ADHAAHGAQRHAWLRAALQHRRARADLYASVMARRADAGLLPDGQRLFRRLRVVGADRGAGVLARDHARRFAMAGRRRRRRLVVLARVRRLLDVGPREPALLRPARLLRLRLRASRRRARPAPAPVPDAPVADRLAPVPDAPRRHRHRLAAAPDGDVAAAPPWRDPADPGRAAARDRVDRVRPRLLRLSVSQYRV